MTDPLVKGSSPDNQPQQLQQQQHQVPQSNVRNKWNLFVDALAILFGISSWIGVNSSYLQGMQYKFQLNRFTRDASAFVHLLCIPFDYF